MNAKRSAVFALSLFLVVHVHAATRNNDDSCDISTLPAATLLLPYFEVGLDDVAGETTLFTVTNVTNVDSTNNFAQSNSMVHIRAIADGATFPRTFYRWIQGGASQFQTSYKIWREGLTDGRSCVNARRETQLTLVETVRFDEAENAVGSIVSHLFPQAVPDWLLPPVSNTSVSDRDFFPQLFNGAVSGWFYLNLDRCGAELSGCTDAVASQNWVVVSMRAEGRYSADTDATALGNGCSPPAPFTETTYGTAILGPAPNVNPNP